VALFLASVWLVGALLPDLPLPLLRDPVLTWPAPAMTALAAGLIGAQVYRYARISGVVQRQQTKWVVLGASAAVCGLLALVLLEREARTTVDVTSPLTRLAFAVGYSAVLLLFPLTMLFAMLRYRLFEIDRLLTRALVYGGLTAGIVGIYVVVVGSIGALLHGRGTTLSLADAPAVLAAGLAAVLFQPLRDWLQQHANHLVYGKRADPYHALARLGQRLATLPPEAALPGIVETIAQALKLPYAAIVLKQDRTAEVAATYGIPAGEPFVLPLVDQGQIVGELLVAPRAPGDPLVAADRRLLEDLAHQAAAAVHAVRLTADLRRSRERLVTAREEERRRLRRDLHDGLGPALGALTLQLDAARTLIRRDPEAACGRLAELKGHTQTMLADIRRLAYALRPPTLDELGLIGALRASAAQYEVPNGGFHVRVETPDIVPRLPAAVEVAAYRIATEALSNVARHAEARVCVVRLRLDEPGILRLDVVDDGRGLPPERRAGVGLNSMRERAAELGGTCTVAAAPAGGTWVCARLPLPMDDQEGGH
jgi:signal transduction histidine kinase